MRKTKSADCPGGIPEDLYALPHITGKCFVNVVKNKSELVLCMPTVLMIVIAIKLSINNHITVRQTKE